MALGAERCFLLVSEVDWHACSPVDNHVIELPLADDLLKLLVLKILWRHRVRPCQWHARAAYVAANMRIASMCPAPAHLGAQHRLIWVLLWLLLLRLVQRRQPRGFETPAGVGTRQHAACHAPGGAL